MLLYKDALVAPRRQIWIQEPSLYCLRDWGEGISQGFNYLTRSIQSVSSDALASFALPSKARLLSKYVCSTHCLRNLTHHWCFPYEFPRGDREPCDLSCDTSSKSCKRKAGLPSVCEVSFSTSLSRSTCMKMNQSITLTPENVVTCKA